MHSRNRRYSARHAVKLMFGDAAFPATILNISASGASVALEQTPDIGQAVTLTCFGSRIDGNIRWVGPENVGIAFSRILMRPELMRIRYGIQVSIPHRPFRTKFMEFR